jgi:hypothetical protein
MFYFKKFSKSKSLETLETGLLTNLTALSNSQRVDAKGGKFACFQNSKLLISEI